MNKYKKISSYFLLGTYLLVVAHQSISHTHASDFNVDIVLNHSHKHENFKDHHHEHHFHVGVFHFLGHLFESISHMSDIAEDYLGIIQNTSTKKVTDYKTPIHTFYYLSTTVVYEVNAESLLDPPKHHITFLQKLIRSSLALRAPPFHV